MQERLDKGVAFKGHTRADSPRKISYNLVHSTSIALLFLGSHSPSCAKVVHMSVVHHDPWSTPTCRRVTARSWEAPPLQPVRSCDMELAQHAGAAALDKGVNVALAAQAQKLQRTRALSGARHAYIVDLRSI